MSAFIVLLVLLQQTISTNAIIIKWKPKESLPEKGTISIAEKFLITGDASNNTEYNKHLSKFANYTLDQRCKKGMDLSLGYFLYTPYVDMTNAGATHILLSGIIPNILVNMLEVCCPSSKISHGELHRSIENVERKYEGNKSMDFTFPLYALEGMQTTKFKDSPFVPIVQAPRVVLIVPDSLYQSKNTRTQVLMKTVFNAWPMLIFIFVSACLSGLTVWALDRSKNPREFPPHFFVGAWEGFWWAFVTMTTVGYGDRSPKSILARIFCILWILTGIVLISLFTGLVSAALSASATPVFNIPGSEIGAVRGSKEYQIGVGMNADMKAFANHPKLIDALIRGELHGALVDNFILSAIRDNLAKYRLRLEREVQQPVTYGIALREGAVETEKCFRRYYRHHPERIFETVAEKLKPVKNPTDEVSLEVQAAEKLFYEETIFKIVVYTEVAVLVVLVIIGILWESCVRNRRAGTYGLFHFKKRGNHLGEETHYTMDTKSGGGGCDTSDLEALITEYDSFHEKWISKLQALKATTPDTNGNASTLSNL